MLMVTSTLVVTICEMVSLTAECQCFLTIYFVITFFELIMCTGTVWTPVRNEVIIRIHFYTAKQINNLFQTGEIDTHVVINVNVIQFFQCINRAVNTINTGMGQFIRNTSGIRFTALTVQRYIVITRCRCQ